MRRIGRQPTRFNDGQMREYLLTMLASMQEMARGPTSGSVVPLRPGDEADFDGAQDDQAADLAELATPLRALALRHGHTDIADSLTALEARHAEAVTEAMLARPFGTVDAMVRHHAVATPDAVAVVATLRSGGESRLTYAELDRLADGVAAALQRDGVEPGEIVAVLTPLTCEYAALLVGAFRAGVVAAPLATWLDTDAFSAVLADASPKMVFLCESGEDFPAGTPHVRLDAKGLRDWIGPTRTAPVPVVVRPGTVDLLLYSSGTTGAPKGVAQRRATRWALRRNFAVGDGALLVATPTYSAATLIAMLSTLTTGGKAVLMHRFEAHAFLELAQAHRATHTYLVPIQFRRVINQPDFDRFDLSAFRLKIATGAPMSPALKAEIVRRWPGEFVEIYGMSEGSCSSQLDVLRHPDKLHTVGRPSPGCAIKIVCDDGAEAQPGLIGEIVGRSVMMMAGYHGDPLATAQAEWFDAEGLRYVRTGDLGYLDEDGFLILVGRKRDMIISGGLKIHAADIERVIDSHPDVDEAAVVAAPSQTWGETPVAFVVRRAERELDADLLRDWVNGRVSKVQRLAAIILVDDLPRSPNGKVLKRDLRKASPSYA
jgi:acyl-CoA synthetase (AMP-forming)/AMP-acid ligase II